jgi:hypothetical protein
MTTDGVPSPLTAVATAAVTALLLIRPAGTPLVWLAVPLLLVLVAIHLAAGSQEDDAQRAGRRWRHLAALGVVTAVAEPVWRYSVTLLTGDNVAVADAVPAIGAAGVVIAVSAVTGRIGRHAAEGIAAGRALTGLRSDLLGMVVVTATAAGLLHLNATEGLRWLLAATVIVHVIAAASYLQDARQRAMAAAWGRSGRRVAADLRGGWAAWTSAACAVFLIGVLVWVAPPLEATRTATEQGPRDAVSWLAERFTPASNYVIPDGTFDRFEETPGGGGAEVSGGPWLYVLAGAALALITIRRRRSRPMTRATVAGPVGLLQRFLQGMASLVGLLRRRNTGTLEEPSAGPPPTPARRRTWWRPAEPRAQVIHDYLRMLDRSDRAGLGRPPAQTASEYGEELGRRFPEEIANIRTITDHFNHARYSNQPVNAATATETRQIERRIRAVLRQGQP